MTTRVINCKGGNRDLDVYIGRWTWPIKINSKWRNPYRVKKYGIEKAIEIYREYIMNQPELLRLIPIELKDKTLGCLPIDPTSIRTLLIITSIISISFTLLAIFMNEGNTDKLVRK